MIINVGRLDQVFRIGISLFLVYIAFIDEGFISDPLSSYIIGTIGILNMIVATVRFCPLYIMTGINTCSTKK